MKKPTSRLVGALALAAVAVLGSCSNPFQVIEEVEFAPSLNIDLSQMERLPSGVYIQDLVVGDGLTVLSDSEVRFSYFAFLADGTQFGSGEFTFVMGQGGVIIGVALGMIGMRVRGTRKIIIPPDFGYGDSEQDNIPAGSVLIFDVTLDSIPPDPTGSPGN